MKKISYQDALEMESKAMELLNIRQILFKAQSLVADLLLSAPVPTIVFSLDGKFVYLSPQFTKDTGYETEDLYNKEIISIVHPNDMDATMDAMGYAAKGVEAQYFINRLKLKDKKYHWVLWHPQGPANDPKYGVARMSLLDEIPVTVSAGFVGDPYQVGSKLWIEEIGSDEPLIKG